MKKNGFTLIEVMAVIALIGLLTIFIIPAVVNQVGNKKGQIDEITEKMIYSATKLYIDNMGIQVAHEDCSIKIQDLINKGYLDSSSLKYASGSSIPTSYKIQVTIDSYDQYEFKIKESC